MPVGERRNVDAFPAVGASNDGALRFPDGVPESCDHVGLDLHGGFVRGEGGLRLNS
jgi:hypothetical protein